MISVCTKIDKCQSLSQQCFGQNIESGIFGNENIVIQYWILIIRYCHVTLHNTLQVVELVIKNIYTNTKRDIYCAKDNVYIWMPMLMPRFPNGPFNGCSSSIKEINRLILKGMSNIYYGEKLTFSKLSIFLERKSEKMH